MRLGDTLRRSSCSHFIGITALLRVLDVLDLLPQFVDLLDELHILSHDTDVVLLVDLIVLGEVLLEHGN